MSWTYGYDSLDRLNSATSASVTQGWTYDANGNRLTETGSTPSTYTNSGTSNRVSSISGTLSRSYGYDNAGNTLSYAGATFTYNNHGRMATASNGGVTATYTYNALGQRIRRATSSATTVYLYDEAGHLAGEYTSAGALIQETVWLGDTPVATLRPNGAGGVLLYYVHADHLNTPRLVTDTANNIRWRWDSDAFGTAAPNQNPAGLGSFEYNLRFPGQQYDPVAGLNYNYFRDYDPATGRYAESDPIGLNGGINTYLYTEADPIGALDPDGLAVYRSPGRNYSDQRPSGTCEQAVFAGDYIVAWIPCPDGNEPPDYYLRNCIGGQCMPFYDEGSCPTDDDDLLWELIKPDWTILIPEAKLAKLAGGLLALKKAKRREQLFLRYSSRKRAKDAAANSPGGPWQRDGRTMPAERHGNGDPHFHDGTHDDVTKPNIHYTFPRRQY